MERCKPNPDGGSEIHDGKPCKGKRMKKGKKKAAPKKKAAKRY